MERRIAIHERKDSPTVVNPFRTVVGSKEGELRVVLLAMENDFLEAVEVRDLSCLILEIRLEFGGRGVFLQATNQSTFFPSDPKQILIAFWKYLQIKTSSNDLGFPAIPANFRKILII